MACRRAGSLRLRRGGLLHLFRLPRVEPAEDPRDVPRLVVLRRRGGRRRAEEDLAHDLRREVVESLLRPPAFGSKGPRDSLERGTEPPKLDDPRDRLALLGV